MTPSPETVAILNMIVEGQIANSYAIAAEHYAVNVPNLNSAIEYHLKMGWSLLTTNGVVAFMNKGGHTTELVTGEIPPHFAYVSPEVEHIDRIEGMVRSLIKQHIKVKISKTGNTPKKLRFIMIETAPDEFVQFIWRVEPLIPLAQAAAE